MRPRSIATILAAALGIVMVSRGSGNCSETAVLHSMSSQSSGDGAFQGLILEASRRFAFPAQWISEVLHAESGGNVRAVSPKGAVGLMQILPATYAWLRQGYGFGADPFLPRDNILAGTAYLRELYDRYGSPGFLAAYNAGPTRYEAQPLTGRPLPNETIEYVRRLAPKITGGVDFGSIGSPILRERFVAPLFVNFRSRNTDSAPSVARDSGVVRPVRNVALRLSSATPNPFKPIRNDLFVGGRAAGRPE